MLRTKSLLWWIPALVVAMLAVAEGGMHMSAARAARRHQVAEPCAATRQVAIDVDGDGLVDTVRMVRVGDEAWADVWSGDSLRSSTRLGQWRDDAAIAAIDADGDGRLDIVRTWSEGPEEHAQVWLSDGASAFEEGWSGVTGATCVASR